MKWQFPINSDLNPCSIQFEGQFVDGFLIRFYCFGTHIKELESKLDHTKNLIRTANKVTSDISERK
jgi:hypothetical protein